MGKECFFDEDFGFLVQLFALIRKMCIHRNNKSWSTQLFLFNQEREEKIKHINFKWSKLQRNGFEFDFNFEVWHYSTRPFTKNFATGSALGPAPPRNNYATSCVFFFLLQWYNTTFKESFLSQFVEKILNFIIYCYFILKDGAFLGIMKKNRSNAPKKQSGIFLPQSDRNPGAPFTLASGSPFRSTREYTPKKYPDVR